MGEEKKINRRDYLKYTGAAIGGLVVGGALGYLAKPAEVVEKTVTAPGVEKTVTVTAPGAIVTAELPKIPLLPPGEKNPWLYDKLKGTTLRMLEDTYNGRILEWYADLLKKEVGIEVLKAKVVDFAVNYSEVLSALETESKDFPLIQTVPNYLSDWVLRDKLEPLDKYLDMFYGSDEYLMQIMPAYREFYMKCEGKYYGLPMDGDLHVWAYVSPFYELEKFRSAYKEWHPDRKLLTAPPETWEDWYMQCKFFATQVLPDDKTIPNVEVLWPVIVWGAPPWSWSMYFNTAASMGVNYFDKEMEIPLYPQDKAVEALEFWYKLSEFMPEGVENFGGSETVEYWVEGKAISQIWWIDINEYGQRGPVAGLLKNGLMPGYPSPEKGKIVHKAVMPVGRIWIIPKYFDEKTKLAAFYAAYHLSHWHYSLASVADSDAGLDPFMYIHYSDIGAYYYTIPNPYKKPSPEWPSTVSVWPKFEDAKRHLEGGLANMSVGFPQPTLVGAFEYMEALSREVQQVLAGSKTPKKAIDDAAAAWIDIRDKYFGIIGKERYLSLWKEFYGTMAKLGYL
jgi:multiple sugar transport system substrate-binding protein